MHGVHFLCRFIEEHLQLESKAEYGVCVNTSSLLRPSSHACIGYSQQCASVVVANRMTLQFVKCCIHIIRARIACRKCSIPLSFLEKQVIQNKLKCCCHARELCARSQQHEHRRTGVGVVSMWKCPEWCSAPGRKVHDRSRSIIDQRSHLSCLGHFVIRRYEVRR